MVDVTWISQILRNYKFHLLTYTRFHKACKSFHFNTAVCHSSPNNCNCKKMRGQIASNRLPEPRTKTFLVYCPIRSGPFGT